jgi:hypothetical protein
MTESMLEMAARHVAEGNRILARHKQMIAELQAKGMNTLSAEQTLDVLLATQRIFEEHLAQIRERGGGR